MQPGFVQLLGTNFVGGTNNYTITPTANTTVGHTIIIGVKGSTGATVTSVTDTHNSYTVINSGGAANTAALIYATLKVALTTSDTITINISNTGASAAQACEYSFIAPLTAVEASTGTSANGVTTISNTAIAPSRQPNIFIGVLTGGAGTNCAATGYNVRADYNNGGSTYMVGIADKITTSTGSNGITWTWTGAANSAATLAVFGAAPSGNFLGFM